MQDLVLFKDQVCSECEFEKLIPYKGNEANAVGPDRLICPKCGKEYAIYAIAINSKERRLGRLSDLFQLENLNNFLRAFADK